MAVNPVAEIAGAIKAGFKLITTYKKSKHVTRLRKAVDAGEDYILINEGDNLDMENKSKRLAKAKKRFFKYNQG